MLLPVTPMFEMTLVHEDHLTPDLQGVMRQGCDGMKWDISPRLHIDIGMKGRSTLIT